MSEKKYYYEPSERADSSTWDSTDWMEYTMGPRYFMVSRDFERTSTHLALTDPDFRGFAIDDLDHTVLANTTVNFSLDGADYELDLTHEHAAELRAVFADYIQAARVVGSQVADAPAPPET
jgi:hypothetical protein